MTYDFKDAKTKTEYKELIHGTQSVKSCKGSIASDLVANCTTLICGKSDSKDYATCKLDQECKGDVTKCTWDLCQTAMGKTNVHCIDPWKKDHPSQDQFMDPAEVKKCKAKAADCTKAICGNPA